ncbi:MAG: hypothetical protein HDT09_02365 [Bacteroidales bacterium]|nr:hypothetical protein [Bacteroidales bacterium]
MATYKSPATQVNIPAEELAAKFADFTALQSAMEAMPAEKHEKIGNVEFTKDTIKIVTPQVGAITLRATERTPEQIVLEAEGSPVPMKLMVGMTPVGSSATSVTGTIDVELPMMLKPLIGPAMQKAADQFGNMFASLA